MNDKTGYSLLFLGGLAFLLALGMSIFLAVQGYILSRDITDYLERAQVASDANDMYHYLSLLRQGMENYDMTKGHAALIFKRPENDMVAIYQAVVASERRAKELTEFNTSTEAGRLSYDTRLDDLRGVLRELTIPAYGYWWRHQGLWAAILCAVSWIVFTIFAVWFTVYVES